MTNTVGDTVGSVGKGVGNTVGGESTQDQIRYRDEADISAGATEGVGNTAKGAGDTVSGATGGSESTGHDAQNPLGLSK